MKSIDGYRQNFKSISEVKSGMDIFEIVRQRVELSPAGPGRYRGLCPFHSEKSPSFFVDAKRQRYQCFGCGERGDVFDFLQKTRGVSLKDILKDLTGGAIVRWAAPDREEARRRMLVHRFREWERSYSELLCQWVGAVNRLLFRACKGPDDLDRYAEIIRLKGVCENHLHSLAYNSDRGKIWVVRPDQIRKRGLPCLTERMKRFLQKG